MTNDPLDQLKAALKRDTPAPSDAARAAALRAAAENFEKISQGSAQTARPMSDRPRVAGGFWTGVTTMLTRLTAPRLLMGTSALATCAIAVVLVQNIGPLGKLNYFPGKLDDQPVTIPTTTTTVTPAPAPVAAPKQATENETVLRDEVSEADLARQAPPPQILSEEMGGRSDERRRELGAALVAPAETAPSAAGVDSAIMAPEAAQNFAAAPQRRSIAQSDSIFIAPPVPPADFMVRPDADTEAYPAAEANPLKRTADAPVSTFSIDVDTASYGVVRSSLQNGRMPPRAAVRVEEMVNYFEYSYPAPDSAEVPFATSVSVTQTPWNPDTRLLHIGIQGYEMTERPPLNLVFLIDTSGSMNDTKKLPLLVQSFKLLLDTLTEEDSIAIVTYAGSAGMALEPTPAGDRARILAALDRLAAGGSTAGQAGLQQAYALAADMAGDGEISRVILATDGDFNVGISDPEALKTFIEEKRESGTYLSVLGFGRGNYDDATMQSLAQNGNGIAAYIDTLAEAQKVLVEDMTANLFPIAGDVKIQVEFNPAQISEYRLIGYETRALNREDFNNDAVDAGEIGAGHTVTALYEITPKGSPAEQISDLRYAEPTAQDATEASAEYAFLKLRYKRPGEQRSNLIETPVLPDRSDIAAEDTAFAASVAAFGQLLRGDQTLGDWSYRDTLALATANRGEDRFGYRAEFLTLVRLADALD